MRTVLRVVALLAVVVFVAGLVYQGGWRRAWLATDGKSVAGPKTPGNGRLESGTAPNEGASEARPAGNPWAGIDPPVSAETGEPLPDVLTSRLLFPEETQPVATDVPPVDEREGMESDLGDAPDDSSAPPRETALGRSLQQLVDQTSEYLKDAQGDANDAITTGDRMLADAKTRNREALRQANRQVRRPNTTANVVVFVIEDLSCEDLGCYGQPLLATPRIDQLAEDGVRLTRFLSWTQGHAANRWAFLTGDQPNDSTGRYLARPAHATLPEMLWQSGYTTALLGDCSWAGVRDSEQGGWDHWFGWENPAIAVFPPEVFSNGALLRVPANSATNDAASEVGTESSVAPSRVPFDQLLVEDLDSFLAQPRNGRPLAVVVSLRLSWWKERGASDADKRGDGEQLESEQGVIDPSVAGESWTDAEKRHATAVMAVDSLVGHVTRRVEAVGGPQRTAVVLLGLPPRRKRNETNVFLKSMPAVEAAAATATGKTSSKTAKLVAAPCLVRWPGQLPEGGTISSACGFQDLLPTIAELARSQRRPSVQGISQAKAWRGN